MKLIFNKIKKIFWLVLSHASKVTKITSFFLFTTIVLLSFEISEEDWYFWLAWFLFLVFSVQLTLEFRNWIYKWSRESFNRRSFLISASILAVGVIFLIWMFSLPSGGTVYQTNILRIIGEVIMNTFLILTIVAIIPLTYLTIRIPFGPPKIKSKGIMILRRKLILIPVYSILGLVGLFVAVLLIGWGLYTSQEFVSRIYWDKYFCGPSKIEKAMEGVVRIKTESGSGTGFWIDKDLVLTNNHVVLFDESINIVAPDATYYSADVVQTDTIKDLAILRITRTTDYKEPKILKWRKRWPDLVEDVFVLGFPKGTKDITATRGIVSSLTNDEFDSTKYIQTDAAINEGNSGGPLVDICGRVLGINSSTLLDAENIGFAINGSRIQDQLKEMIIASKKITTEEVKVGQTGGETEVVIKYYLTVSRGDFENAYDYYSENLKSRVLFKGWKESYKNTFAIRFKSAKMISLGVVEVVFRTVDFPESYDEDYAVKEFRGTWSLVREGGIWKLNYSNIREAELEDEYY